MGICSSKKKVTESVTLIPPKEESKSVQPVEIPIESTDNKDHTFNPLPHVSGKGADLEGSTIDQDSGKLSPKTSNGSSLSETNKPTIPTEKTGIIGKQGKRFKTFSERYFILKEGILSNFTDETSSKKYNTSNIQTETKIKKVNLKGFNVSLVSDKHQIILGSGQTSLTLQLKNDEQYTAWTRALNEHVAYANGFSHINKPTALGQPGALQGQNGTNGSPRTSPTSTPEKTNLNALASQAV